MISTQWQRVCSLCGLQRVTKIWIRAETWEGSLHDENIGKRMVVRRMVQMKAWETQSQCWEWIPKRAMSLWMKRRDLIFRAGRSYWSCWSSGMMDTFDGLGI